MPLRALAAAKVGVRASSAGQRAMVNPCLGLKRNPKALRHNHSKRANSPQGYGQAMNETNRGFFQRPAGRRMYAPVRCYGLLKIAQSSTPMRWVQQFDTYTMDTHGAVY